MWPILSLHSRTTQLNKCSVSNVTLSRTIVSEIFSLRSKLVAMADPQYWNDPNVCFLCFMTKQLLKSFRQAISFRKRYTKELEFKSHFPVVELGLVGTRSPKYCLATDQHSSQIASVRCVPLAINSSFARCGRCKAGIVYPTSKVYFSMGRLRWS